MKNNCIKNISTFTLLISILIADICFCTSKLNYLKDKDDDYVNTFSYFAKTPTTELNGDFIVIGDSYAFLFAKHVNEDFNYLVHQGYDIDKIYSDLIPMLKGHNYKYAYLLIGPNDFMEQTDLLAFSKTLQTIVYELKACGMQVIMSDYCEPKYSFGFTNILQYLPNKCIQYSIIVADIISINELIHVPLVDLVETYGYMIDGIHPNEKIYSILFERLKMKLLDKNEVG